MIIKNIICYMIYGEQDNSNQKRYSDIQLPHWCAIEMLYVIFYFSK